MKSQSGQVILSPLDMTAAWVSEDAGSVTFLCPQAMQSISIPIASYLARFPASTVVRSTSKDALARLRLASEYSMALDLALLLFDESVSLETRAEIAVELDEMLTSGNCENYVLDILLAAPLYKTADRDGATRVAAGRVRVPEFVRVICERQERVRAVWLAWQGQKEETIAVFGDFEEFTGMLIDAGIFRRLATEVTSQSELKLFQKQIFSDSALTDRINGRILKSFLSIVGTELPRGKPQPYIKAEAVRQKLLKVSWRISRFRSVVSEQLAAFGRHVVNLQMNGLDRIAFIVTSLSIITVCLAIACFVTASPWTGTLFLSTSIGICLGLLYWSFGRHGNVDQHLSDLSYRFGFPVLGRIPFLTKQYLHSETLDGGIAATVVTLYRPTSDAAEAFHAVRKCVSSGMHQNNHALLCVTSASPGDGKSTLATNLAVSFAQTGRRVLLMEGDLHRPKVHQLFGHASHTGVAQLLEGSVSLSDAVQSSSQVPNLSLLTCGNRPTSPARLLSGTNFAQLLSKVRSQYDLVIIDTPPIMAVDDPLTVAALSDAVLLCVRHSHSRLQRAANALSRLRGVGAAVLGVVVNGVSERNWPETVRKPYPDPGSDVSEPSAKPGVIPEPPPATLAPSQRPSHSRPDWH